MDYMNFIQHMNFQNLTWQIVSTLVFIITDVIIGIITAIILNNLDSKKMRQGLLRKILLILIVILSFVIQYSVGLTMISKLVCGYIIIMECLSILENIKKAGIDLGKLGELLKQEKIDKKGE